jgi:hypothetical protein
MRTARTARIGTGGIGIIDTITEPDTVGLSMEAVLRSGLSAFHATTDTARALWRCPLRRKLSSTSVFWLIGVEWA